VAFNAGFRRALLADINPHLIRFYQAVKDGTITPASVREFLEREGRLLKKAEDNGYAHFRLVKDRFNNQFDPLDFLFLSRAGFNGMMRFNRKGQWNIPFCQKPERFAPAYVTKISNQVHDVACLIKPEWVFRVSSFEDIIREAAADDIIYCDPPYIGRYVDYYSGWTEDNENQLHALLTETPARFIMSTWHHNDYRANDFITKLWGTFNVVTRDHFYHSGGKLENRRSVVEALVFNFPANIQKHNHGIEPKPEQMILLEERAKYIAQQVSRTHE
jgi:DNA adenine methylase